MKSILQDEKKCYATGSTVNLHKHHIFFGSANRKISEREGFWVWLRADFHNMSDYGVHFNKDFDLQLKQECQQRYEHDHSRGDFIRLIGRNYLDY